MNEGPIDLNEKRRQKERRKKQENDIPPLALIVQAVARQMISGDSYPDPFSEKFVICCPAAGEYIFYKAKENGVLSHVGKEGILDAIEAWVSKNNVHYPELVQSTRFPQMVFSHWRAVAPKIEGLIKPFKFLGQKGYVLHEASFLPDLMKEYPDLDVMDPEVWKLHPITEFLSRASNPDALCAFIGSIFYDQSYIQQYLYLHGPGGAGKGTILRLLNSILGPASHSDDLELAGGRFWACSFIGKRLVAFSDSDEKYAMQKAIFKRLTGGDSIRMEIKNGATFNAVLNCKYLINSNYEPVLKMDDADQRRAVVIHVDKVQSKLSASYEQIVQDPDEARFFVEYCCYKYRTMCMDAEGNHLPIPVGEDQLEYIENSDHDIEEEIFSKFCFKDGGICQSRRLKELLGPKFQRVSNNTISRVLRDRFKCGKFRANNYENGIRNQTVYYVGIEVKPVDTMRIDGTWGSNFEEVERENTILRERWYGAPQYLKAKSEALKLRGAHNPV
jgi:energy-coupling factor transporter ATP-binding protein EcfA2